MSSGFYKNNDGNLIHAPNAVFNKDYELLKEDKELLRLPIDGWYWFDTKEDALEFFELEGDSLYDLIKSVLKIRGVEYEDYEIDEKLKEIKVNKDEPKKFDQPFKK